jgi:hypothetical protein
MKKLFLIIFLLTAVIGFSQTTVYKQTFDGATVWGFYFTDIDSATTNIYYSNYFDISTVDNQTLYLTYSAISGTGKHDDSLLVLIQGRTPYGLADTAYMVFNLDSQIVKCSAGDSIKQATLSLTGYAPWVRIYVTQYVGSSGVRNDNRNSLNIRLTGAIYAKLQDPMYMPRVPWR